MLQRALQALAVCACLASAPAGAETAQADVAGRAGAAQAIATKLQAYLDSVAKSGGRPDFGKPPAAALLTAAIDPKQLDALATLRGDDLLAMTDWITAVNGINKSIMFFGMSPPEPQTDPAAFQRNVSEFEPQESAVGNFLLRLTAREIPVALAFLDQLPLEQRTPIRQEGFRKMRVANAQLILNYLGWIAGGMQPANARLISAAMRDTAAAWTSAILPTDRPTVLRGVAQVRGAIKDEETRDNLAAFAEILQQAK